MKQKKTLFAATGIPSLFLIFGSVMSGCTCSSDAGKFPFCIKFCQTFHGTDGAVLQSPVRPLLIRFLRFRIVLSSYYKNSAGEDA